MYDCDCTTPDWDVSALPLVAATWRYPRQMLKVRRDGRMNSSSLFAQAGSVYLYVVWTGLPCDVTLSVSVTE
ncbi:hypothetical protein STENM223S_08414 [Streptomyces tendae]